jgi:hypothetical protein
VTYDEIKGINDMILVHSFTPASSFKSEEAQEFQHSNSIPIDDSSRSILKNCLLGCQKIFQDFHKDLKLIAPNLCVVKIENTQEEQSINLAVVMETSKTKLEINIWTKISELIEDYENNRLKEVKFLLADYICVEEIYRKLIRDLKNLSSLSNSGNHKSIKESINSLYIHLIENRYVEFYGYSFAVDLFRDFIRSKNIEYFKRFAFVLAGLLHISISKTKVSLLEIFYKFDEIYFEDLNKQLTKMNAMAIKVDDNNFDIVCTSKLLNIYKGRLFKVLKMYEKSNLNDECDQENFVEKYEEILKWNALVREFVNMYLSNFSVEKIDNMPFARDEKESENISYNPGLLDVNWLSARSVKVLGLKQEVDSFKQKISGLYLMMKS